MHVEVAEPGLPAESADSELGRREAVTGRRMHVMAVGVVDLLFGRA